MERVAPRWKRGFASVKWLGFNGAYCVRKERDRAVLGSPETANRARSIAILSKIPNWTKLMADSVKLGVSANHVIALRVAKIMQGDAAARREPN